ncbi:MAG: GNAT family N-acetyltransferase [Acidimicrobiia bacterium]|nr:GNAT family N-acetyltransferase [Acidimicrobiia bacterium]
MRTSSDSSRVRDDGIETLASHGRIPIAFMVERTLDVVLIDAGLGGVHLRERRVPAPWVKDYDALDGEGPSRWATRFDISRWGLLGAYEDAERVGGVVIAWGSPDVRLLADRADLAFVWDLRVRPDHRRKGIGSELLWAAYDWAAERGCREIGVETQNVNVPACRLYAREGFHLTRIDRSAYPDLPEETQLLWRRAL